MRMIPGWLIALIVIAVIFFLLNALGVLHVHFSVSGSLSV
jgi:hypothetical protein